MFEIELIIYIKMDLALNNLQRLICHKNKPTNQQIKKLPSLTHPNWEKTQASHWGGIFLFFIWTSSFLLSSSSFSFCPTIIFSIFLKTSLSISLSLNTSSIFFPLPSFLPSFIFLTHSFSFWILLPVYLNFFSQSLPSTFFIIRI